MTTGTNFFTKYTSTVDVALTDKSGNATLIRCVAGSLPTDAGYAVGCIAQATDTGVIYYNSGTVSVASFTAVNAGAAALTLPSALTDASTTTGAGFSTNSTAITTGSALKISNGNTTNFTTGGKLIEADMGAAVAGNGLTVTTSAAYTGTGLAVLTAGAMTTGIVLSLISTTGLTSGSLLRATTSTAGALATNGAVSIRATGAFTSTSNAGVLDVQASATTAGTVVNFQSTAAGQTSATVLNIVSSGYTTGMTGNVVAITSASTTGTGNSLLITNVNTTAGNALKIVSNALTLGSGTGILVSHTTSVLGAGTSLVRISSTGIDTGTTTGVLLDLSTTSAVGATQVLLTDSSADTSARTGIQVSITNAAAVAAVPFKSSNVAVSNVKFTKHFVMTDGTKVVTIWISQDATTPNGTLSGTAGDICLNGPSSRMFYCTGTTNWTASNA